MDALCNITYLVKVLCYSVKFIDYVCMLLDFISDAIIGTVERSNLFIYNIFIIHKRTFELRASKLLIFVFFVSLSNFNKNGTVV